MRNLSELEVIKGRGPSASLRDVAYLEALVGKSLPADYRFFLLELNGGCPMLDTYANERGSWAVNEFFFLGDDASFESLVWNYRNRPAALASNCLPFAGDGGGNIFFLDLAEDKGGVGFWVHDEPGREVALLAKSFGEFIDGLRENPDYI